MLSYHNLPDLSRKRKERDEVYEAEYPHTPDYMMELHLARKKQATRFGIHTPLKHESVFDLSRGHFVRPLSCLSLPRPKQELSPFEQMPQEIMLKIVMCLKEITDDEAEVIDPRRPSLDILAVHFTSKTLAAATLDQHNHVVGISTKAAFKASVNEFNDKFSLAVLACATCRMAKDIAVDGFDDNSFDLNQTQRQCLPCSLHLRIGTTISIHKIPYFLCTGCAAMKLTYGATWRQDARYPEWCSIRDKVIRACFDSPPHAELHGHADAQSRDRICKDCFIKVRAIFADQSRGCMCVRCTGQPASVIVSKADDVS